MEKNTRWNFTLKSALLLAAALGLFSWSGADSSFSGFGPHPASAHESESIPANLAIDMNRAVEIARQHGGGRVAKIELEQENGQWVYEAELVSAGGGEKEILIDANTGTVIQVREEREDDEDKDEHEKHEGKD